MDTNRNLTLLTDLYELTMAYGYFLEENKDTVVFDVYFRKNPGGSGYTIACGLQQIIEYINNFHFNEEDIAYLRSIKLFNEDFLNYLKDLKFSGNIYAIKEGTPIFPKEPVIKIEAPIIQAQIIETAILNIFNHQTLIATKAARVCYVAKNRGVLEFGLRRAQGPDAGLYGARAAMIGGCVATSNVLAGKMFDVAVKGTHAHSWIMSFDSEYLAFKKYAQIFPSACILLVDTYDSLKSGIPNAIKVFTELKKENKLEKGYGIRLDSGDLAYLSKKARKMLDEAGLEDALISVSNDLDEYLIFDLINQGACINILGVGTNMITSKDCPSLGGVYKLAAIKSNDNMYVPKIKLSDNVEKITNPGNKKIYRVFDQKTHKMLADLICLVDEYITNDEELELFDPDKIWKKLILSPNTYYLEELLLPIFENGRQVYFSPSVNDIAKYSKLMKETLWDEVKRLYNPHEVYIDLSKKLYDLKEELIKQQR
ncbi:MAG: nicotinate phosphoribosyltransferase [Erysipelotrichaceae bacterium]